MAHDDLLYPAAARGALCLPSRAGLHEPVCESCHRGPLMGWHGQRRMWAIKKMGELDALNVTVRRLLGS